MSETTLTKDEVDEMRAEAAFALDATDGVPYRVRPIDVIRLCDAAERAETLEAEHLSDRMLAEDDANTIRHLRAQLTELRQLRERAESDADEAIRGQLAAVKRAEAAEAQLTEVTRESVTRAQAEQRVMDLGYRLTNPTSEINQILDALFQAPTPR